VAEQTVFTTMDLPEGKDWEWFSDCNVVALSRRLDCNGKIRAVRDLQHHWERRHLSVIHSA
jgi:hypothetical protein